MLRLIENKKLGVAHNTDQINWLINNLDHIPDYQISAWLMAVCLNGLNDRETQDLTKAMAYSGHVLTLQRHSLDTNNRGFVDKHSTGGVGDKVSIVLSPVLAALGFKVSKFSGRALGHTGGTIDKLEAIPGFRTNLSMKEFERQIENYGLALAAQSLEFAPADKKLYALRDKSGTVDSIPLIASSIMSKKIAGGADIILLDVKVGSGAFMKDLNYASKLAKQMVNIGKGLNLQTKAIISNMEEPLGAAIGNGLELVEALQILDGSLQNDTYELVLELCSTIAKRSEVIDVISSGKAYVKMQEWVTAQGGDINQINTANKAQHILECRSTTDAYIKSLDALTVAQAVHELAYKTNAQGTYDIDNSAGTWLHAKTASRVHPGDLLFTIQGSNLAELELAKEQILSAYKFSHSKVRKAKLILKQFV
jgi:pyrimidine-nucleoside phosphorylase